MILIILAVPSISFATSGACSSHNGVNCSMGMQSNGKVFCNDGWTESTTDYDFTSICKNIKYICSSAEREALLQKYNMSEMYKNATAEINQASTEIADAEKVTGLSSNRLPRIEQLKSTWSAKIKLTEITIHSLESQIETECEMLGRASAEIIKNEGIKRIEEFQANQVKIENTQSNLNKLNLAKLETDLQNLKNKLANYCTDTYGPNSHSNGTSCPCNTGYFLGKENKCISLSSWCSETYGLNTYIKDDKCLCLDGYSYDSTSKTCKILEIKKAVAQPIVIKNIPIKTTPIIKPSDSLKNPVKNEFLNSVVLPKEEVAPIVTPEPVIKIKWYQKIFNWFIGK